MRPPGSPLFSLSSRMRFKLMSESLRARELQRRWDRLLLQRAPRQAGKRKRWISCRIRNSRMLGSAWIILHDCSVNPPQSTNYYKCSSMSSRKTVNWKSLAKHIENRCAFSTLRAFACKLTLFKRLSFQYRRKSSSREQI